MAVSTIKHSKEALAFLTLFKTMKPEVKKEVRDIIILETALIDDYQMSTDMMTAMSEDSFGAIWDTPENEHWDNFIKDRIECTSKEI